MLVKLGPPSIEFLHNRPFVRREYGVPAQIRIGRVRAQELKAIVVELVVSDAVAVEVVEKTSAEQTIHDDRVARQLRSESSRDLGIDRFFDTDTQRLQLLVL